MSWVRGRPSGLPEILVAIAWASKDPIQIGRYRSASFSFRITRCWAVGMWIRMLSTATSMRFFILRPILPLGLRSDPDREVPVRLLLLQDHQVLGGRHVDPDAVDRDLDEVFHPPPHSTSGASGHPPV